LGVGSSTSGTERLLRVNAGHKRIGSGMTSENAFCRLAVRHHVAKRQRLD
jgi:hypothetical protein